MSDKPLTPEEENALIDAFGRLADQWREQAALLAEVVVLSLSVPHHLRKAILRVLREAEPPGSTAAAVRRGYRAAKDEPLKPASDEAQRLYNRLVECAKTGAAMRVETGMKIQGNGKVFDVVLSAGNW